MQPARLRNFSTVPLTGVVGGVRAASCVAFGSVHAVVERVMWLEREAVLRAAGRGDLVVVGVFEVWHGEAGLTCAFLQKTVRAWRDGSNGQRLGAR